MQESKRRSKLITDRISSGWLPSLVSDPIIVAEMIRRAALPKAKAKRKETFQSIQHQQGEKNSQYGTCWVSNSVHTIKIKIELLDEYVSNGYIRGRKKPL
jgi:hypothetical protein